MPFVSQAQRRFMYATHPQIAAEMSHKTPKGAKLPERVKGKKKRQAPAKATKMTETVEMAEKTKSRKNRAMRHEPAVVVSKRQRTQASLRAVRSRGSRGY